MKKFNFISLPDVPVEITSVSELFSEQEYWLTYPLVQMHECHSNAFQIALNLGKGIEIVEGYIMDASGNRITHSYNKIGDKYFDFTLEKFSPAFNTETYLAKRIYTKDEMFSVIAALGGNCSSFEGIDKKKYCHYIDDEGILRKVLLQDKYFK